MENSIVELLAKLGHHPVRKSGKEHIYHSMLRDDDHSPSFTVDDDLGVWYDHGTGQGGNYITLAVRLGQERPEQRPRKKFATKLPHYLVQNIQEVGDNPAIVKYVTERGLWALRDKLKEVYYYVEDEKKLRKYFFAAGWQNDLGGWEVRNRYFKGCLGRKALTSVPGHDDTLCLFEGYFDYLSWLAENSGNQATVIILNTLVLLSQTFREAGRFRYVEVYFDHDNAGRLATAEFLKEVPHAVDRSGVYRDHNDYNEYIVSSCRNR